MQLDLITVAAIYNALAKHYIDNPQIAPNPNIDLSTNESVKDKVDDEIDNIGRDPRIGAPTDMHDALARGHKHRIADHILEPLISIVDHAMQEKYKIEPAFFDNRHELLSEDKMFQVISSINNNQLIDVIDRGASGNKKPRNQI